MKLEILYKDGSLRFVKVSDVIIDKEDDKLKWDSCAVSEWEYSQYLESLETVKCDGIVMYNSKL